MLCTSKCFVIKYLTANLNLSGSMQGLVTRSLIRQMFSVYFLVFEQLVSLRTTVNSRGLFKGSLRQNVDFCCSKQRTLLVIDRIAHLFVVLTHLVYCGSAGVYWENRVTSVRVSGLNNKIIIITVYPLKMIFANAFFLH